jgi:hypothetical protein
VYAPRFSGEGTGLPISFQLDRERRRMRTEVTGSVSVAEVLEHFAATHRERALGYAELIDARGVHPPFLSATDLWSAASAVRASGARPPFGPRAVLVGSEVTFGLTRIFATLLSDHLPLSVFRDPREADRWLAGQPLPADPEAGSGS